MKFPESFIRFDGQIYVDPIPDRIDEEVFKLFKWAYVTNKRGFTIFKNPSWSYTTYKIRPRYLLLLPPDKIGEHVRSGRGRVPEDTYILVVDGFTLLGFLPLYAYLAWGRTEYAPTFVGQLAQSFKNLKKAILVGYVSKDGICHLNIRDGRGGFLLVAKGERYGLNVNVIYSYDRERMFSLKKGLYKRIRELKRVAGEVAGELLKNRIEEWLLN